MKQSPSGEENVQERGKWDVLVKTSEGKVLKTRVREQELQNQGKTEKSTNTENQLLREVSRGKLQKGKKTFRGHFLK